MGEDVGKLGGVFRITDGLQKDFGEDRVIDTPLAESGIIGTAVGLAIRGYRPSARSSSTASSTRRTTRSCPRSPRCTTGRGQAAAAHGDPDPVRRRHRAVEHHSESPEAYFAHTAGLKVVACSNPETPTG
jgi:pyruvate dehydrogenase E1 component beta subunit